MFRLAGVALWNPRLAGQSRLLVHTGAIESVFLWLKKMSVKVNGSERISVVPQQALGEVLRPIAQARGLPNELYTRTEAFAEERERIFASHWTCIGFSSDVASVGDARPVSLAGMPLVMIRQRGGDIGVFHNVCRHRGFQLVQQQCRLRGSIVCPYHSWTYSLEGELKGTPSIGGPGINEVDGFDKSSFGLFPVRSVVWLNMVFVDLSDRAPAFEDYIKPLLDRWQPLWGNGGVDAYKTPASNAHFELELNTNWKFAVENYCESYHLPWIHPGLNSYSRLEDHYHIMVGDHIAGQGSVVYAFCEQAGIELPSLHEWPDDRSAVAEYIALYPNVLLGLQKDHAYGIVIEPIDQTTTRERIEIWYVDEAIDGDAYANARKVVRDGWKEVFVEDIIAVEGMQKGRNSPAYDGGRFSPVMDNPTHHFHQWVARQLSHATDDAPAACEDKRINE